MFSFDFLKSKSQVRDIVIIVLAVIIFHWPLFSNGFFQTDDGTLLIIRAGAFLNSFSDLHIPVRIVENLNYGYGYPIFNFFYPGFFYLTEAFHLLGLGLIVSIKASILLLAITGAIGMYLLSQQITNYRLASISAAFFYLFSPYHILDLYKRGSFGELFALAFIPFVTLGIIDYLQKKRKMSLAIAVISTSLVIVGHNTLSIILLPSAYIFGLLFSGFNFANIKKILLVFAFGITVPAFFWVPAIFESIYTVQSKIKIADYTQHFPSLHSFFSDIPFLSPIIRSESNSFPVSIFISLETGKPKSRNACNISLC